MAVKRSLHINPKTIAEGSPKATNCRAKNKCPFKGEPNSHFPSREAAENWIQNYLQEQHGLTAPSISLESSETALTQNSDNSIIVENVAAHPQNTATATPSAIPKPNPGLFKNTPKSKEITREELISMAEGLAATMSDADWHFLQNFHDEVRAETNTLTRKGRFAAKYENKYERMAENVNDFLQSDNEIATKAREFLGDEIDLRNFSYIFTGQVRSMTESVKWSKQNSIARAVLTTSFNDMTRQRYAASVMFFGGRCCYCNIVLTKGPPPERQATGEHITPVSPENKEAAYGATRYGNMVLCCFRCNNSRSNKELVEWMKDTDRIPEDQKAHSLARIMNFRRFALYSEFTSHQNKVIKSKLNVLYGELRKLKKDGELTEEQLGEFRMKIRLTILDLQELLR